MSYIVTPPAYRIQHVIKELVRISERDYKGVVFYLVGIRSNDLDLDYINPDVWINLDIKHITPIVSDLMPQYIDNTIESVRSNIEWNKARTMEGEAELEKLIKLKEKYK